jgi:hypothetical protein
MVELWEAGSPGAKKLAIPLERNELGYGDEVRIWKSYQDGRYHYERAYDAQNEKE